ncbi:RHOMBOID-like protein 12 [Perilla frutescens var. hirtella]|uniref:RHOMBOID-like protein 12 n=1 Tax=Perilla frutescens var. hirtella TaxID=608512 RepID=A0AAD4P0R1_PERFH|nr:RHOMBOID-like protein 12 [Perilla frutescens var. hirtella]
MRRQLCVELLSKITRNGSPNSSAFPKSTSNPFHQRALSHYSTLSRSHLWKICTPNAISATMRNAVFPSTVLAKRFFSSSLLKMVGKYPTLRNRRLLHSSEPLDYGGRSFFRRFTTDGVVLGLIITNVAVFVLWNAADRQFMVKNFVLSLDSFKSGRLHTLITSAFSDTDGFHLLANMIGLYYFGTSIGRNFGPQYLLKLYLSGAIAGSLFHLAYNAFKAPAVRQSDQQMKANPSNAPAMGASGAVNAILLLDIFLFPTKTVYLEMLIPMPAMFVGILIIGLDMIRAWQGNSKASGPVQFGGTTVAALSWLQMRKKLGRFRPF